MSATKAPLPGLVGRGVGVRGRREAIHSTPVTGGILNDQCLSPESLKGERIPARGKLVFERRPGSPIKNIDLPCKVL